MKRKIICIVGPTASGKTSLGIWLANKINGEIISADSRQVYKRLDIGTGKDLQKYGSTKYHLIDICEPEEKFTVFDWLERARPIIEDVFSRGKVPIIIGGTGLYVQALIEGFEIKHDSTIRSTSSKIYSRKQLDKFSLLELQKLCKQLNVEKKNLDMQNSRRLIRAIELVQKGDRPAKSKPNFEAIQIGITLDRQQLYDKIDQRVDAWFQDGFEDEVQKLLNSNISANWLVSLGLEYRYLTIYLLAKQLGAKNSKVLQLIENCRLKAETFDDSETMIVSMKFAIHHYARRQLTWLRKFNDIKWIDSPKKALEVTNKYLQ